jgi:F-type H+-transporting ATPase subunit delta
MSRIAYRYAKSLLDLCIERNEVDAVAQNMSDLHATIRQSRELELMLTSPVIKGDAKWKVMTALFEKSMGNTTMKFVHLMIEKGRESFLKDVAYSFAGLVRTHRNQVLAEVVTAAPLDAATRQAILVAAQSLTTAQIEITERVDSSLIGGFVVRVGDKQLDASIAQKIKQLKREFSENNFVPGI